MTIIEEETEPTPEMIASNAREHSRYPWAQLKVKQSFIIGATEGDLVERCKRIRASAAHAKFRGLGTFKVYGLTDGRIQVWKTEEGTGKPADAE